MDIQDYVRQKVEAQSQVSSQSAMIDSLVPPSQQPAFLQKFLAFCIVFMAVATVLGWMIKKNYMPKITRPAVAEIKNNEPRQPRLQPPRYQPPKPMYPIEPYQRENLPPRVYPPPFDPHHDNLPPRRYPDDFRPHRPPYDEIRLDRIQSSLDQLNNAFYQLDARLKTLEKENQTLRHRVWLLGVVSNENANLTKQIDCEFHNQETNYLIFDRDWKLNAAPQTLSMTPDQQRKIRNNLVK